MKIITSDTKQEMGQRAASQGAQWIREALANKGETTIIVATGASQFEMLGELVKQPDIRWDKIIAFHLDEYVGISINHPASFRRYLWERFVRRLPSPLRAFHYLDAEGSAAPSENIFAERFAAARHRPKAVAETPRRWHLHL